MKMRLWEKFVNFATLSVIVVGTTLAWNHEHAESNLQRWYDADNKTFFHGELSHAVVQFGNLSKYDADGETVFNEPIDIIIDRDAPDQRGVLRHELCHIQTRSAEHGPLFQACMTRY
jgi:hypothetical protein